ncbi:MAG: MBL fold metallo-hydrolase [Anaerolineales bacterium]|nr:MBL fold metallo-hydrolase [Anaerolineales bacterium]
MKSEPVTIQLSDSAVSIFTIGHLRADLAAWYKLSPEDANDEVRPFLECPVPLPVQSILIKNAGMTVLVDAPKYNIARSSPYAISNYKPPPGLVAQLAQIGITPDAVTHVIITHAHFDHFNGLTIKKKNEILPLFTQARHYLARADWESPTMQAVLAKPKSLENKTFGFLQRQGMLELVDDAFDLSADIRMLPAPGETPGHQIVRVESGGQVLYCLGDLFHHELEFLQPGTAVYWADFDAMINSQQQLIETALAENALLIATHIAGYGRLIHQNDRITWAN